MSQVQNANDVSAVLDDGYPGPVPPAFRDQEAVHGALSNKRQLTWAKPSPDLTARILLRASLVRPAKRPSKWPWAMAAGLVLAGGLSWALVWNSWTKPAAVEPMKPRVVAEAPRPVQPPPIDLSILTRLPARSEPTIMASLEAPLLREVEAVREDTQRGIDLVMSKLPMSVSLGLK